MNHRNKFGTAAGLLLLAVTVVLMVSSSLWAQEEQPRGKMGFWDILMLPRVWMGALFCLAGLGILVRKRSARTMRNVVLPVIFFTFAVLAVLPLGTFARGMGLHPSPVCTVTKPFLFVEGGRGIPVVFPAILFSIAVFSIAGNKLFCGWVCPVGALQEMAYEIPPRRRKKFRLPFKVTNWIRVLAFVVFVPLVFVAGKSIYDYFNPFEALHWGFSFLETGVLIVVLLAALFIFRPFCYLFCPLGLFTWLLEHLSLTRIQVDPDKCITCYNCSDVAPCPAIGPIVDGARSRPDCHACGKCLDTCSENAITFSARKLFRKR
ncbi:MAG: 4Fe-4S binding protein [Candidatus Latescibacterota bacterium]|jgi:polyferredoxin